CAKTYNCADYAFGAPLARAALERCCAQSLPFQRVTAPLPKRHNKLVYALTLCQLRRETTMRRLLLTTLLVASVLVPSLAPSRAAAATFPKSVNVAIIDSTDIINGGSFPTTTSGPTGSFTDFNFFTLPVGSVGAAALGAGGVCGASACDTVLLN